MTQDLKARIADRIAQHEAAIAKCREGLQRADDENEASGKRTTFAEEGCEICDRIAIDLGLLREVLSTEQPRLLEAFCTCTPSRGVVAQIGVPGSVHCVTCYKPPKPGIAIQASWQGDTAPPKETR